MKKFFATLIVVCFVMVGGSKVYALSPADIAITDNQYRVFVSEVYDVSEVSLEYVNEYVETFAKSYFTTTGEKLTWAVCSLCNHSKLQFYVFYDKKAEAYQELINQIDESVDFIQFGTLQDNALLDNTKEAFEDDSVKAALNAIIPIDNDSKKPYESIKKHNLPIYWNIKEDDMEEVYTLEVAVCKYEIKEGDSLSKIAQQHRTTVKRILEKNSNILDSDMIYAGDYLVIK